MRRETPYPGGLDAAKAECKAAIDQKAGEVRLRYITVIPAQDAIYQSKSAEIDDWDATPASEHTEGRFPFIYASKRANKFDTADQARDLIHDRRALWVPKGALSEEIREGGKRAVDAALTVREAFEARDAAVGALDGV